jgi:hypothetical protein
MDPKDLSVDVLYGKPGGGFSPITATEIVVTHLPTGLTASSQMVNHRSQHRARAEAFKVLQEKYSQLQNRKNKMNYTAEQICEFAESNPRLVQIKESKNYPGLAVLKYARRVFYDNLWDQYPILKEFRGLVVDLNYNVVVKPFTKIMNYGENGAGKTLTDDSLVQLTRKVNGFMASVSNYDGQLLISTTGSLDSDFCGYAREYLGDIDPLMIMPGETWMFEVCHPLDPHIVQEMPGAYLLAIIRDGVENYSFDGFPVDIIHHLMNIGVEVSEWVFPIPEMNFRKAREMANRVQHEGFVICVCETGETFKIKSKAYTIKKMMARKEDVLTLNKERVPEEYYPMLEHFSHLDEFKTADEQTRLRLMERWIEENHNAK